MISRILSWLYLLGKGPSAARCKATERRIDRLDVQPGRTRQTGTRTLLDGSVLEAIEEWRPPKEAIVQMVVCVSLGSRVLFHAIKERESAYEVVNQLDRLAHCLLATEEPELPDEWVNELDITWNLFEESLSNGRL